MANSIYKINKGINKSIEFKGLKAQYIWYLCGGVLALLIIYAAMYIAGIPSYICIAMIAVLGTFLFIKVYAMSRKYGEHGLMKALARKSTPKAIRSYSRKHFVNPKQLMVNGK
ncbi:DUF4133 domain-containing protein [Pedobacter sp. UBA4863]|uniref:DUF4133 domain-containing protein n=1 Tax=Pedobacter sp. UBA4863 TaxID=1947060 RepID=UPI0025FE6834|nr:DUF4133 domain-containing protein [Pedobacter sp. UBA4863]